MAPSAAHGLLDRRFLVVLGKGGTGRSTLTAALALRAAARKKRVLVTMAESKERLSSLLGVPPVGHEVQNVLPGIDAVAMTPEAALAEYGMMILRVKTLYKAVMDNRVVKGFLHATPGIDAWSQLGKALFHVQEQVDGRPRYDLVILDAPATGHGLQMLRVPQVICDVAPPGLLRREAEHGLALLRDPITTGMVVVSLPEEMPTTETEELFGALRTELRMPPALLAVNQVLTPLFADRVDAARRAEDAWRAVPEFEPVARAVHTRSVREQIQATMLGRLHALGTPTIHLPALAVEQMGRAEIERLADGLEAAGL